MSEIVNKFLLAGDKFMSEVNLGKPEYTYSACGPFTNNKERTEKFKETRDLQYNYQNESHKTFFNMKWKFIDLTNKTASCLTLSDTGFNIAKNSQENRYR